MSFEEFKNTVAEQILEYLPAEYADADVRIQEVEKNNGCILTGIVIQKNGSNIAPNIYLESFYNQIEDEAASIEKVLSDIARCRVENEVSDFNLNLVTDFNEVKGRLFPKLINKEMNEERLNDLVYSDFSDDLAVIYAIDVMNSRAGKGSVTVTKKMMSDWDGVTVNDLDRISRANIEDTGSFRTMREVLIEMMGSNVPEFMLPPEEEVPSMYVLSNIEKINGANALLNGRLLEQVSKQLGGDFTILPSSIHEVLVLPQFVADERSGELENMVCEVNSTQVAPEERLSDHVYRYDSESKRVCLV